jgi:shikimate kinase
MNSHIANSAAPGATPGAPPLSGVIFLVGFMGSGKSTAGRLLAQRVAWKFVDLDALIEEEEKTSIAEIFQHRGEAAFRQREHLVLRRLIEEAQRGGQASAGAGRVIALGGGTFAQPANFELLQRAGAATIWIECPVEQLLMRCALMPNRPLFRDEASFRRLYDDRLPYYRQATYSVRSGEGDPADVVRQILALPFFKGIQWSDSAQNELAHG